MPDPPAEAAAASQGDDGVAPPRHLIRALVRAVAAQAAVTRSVRTCVAEGAFIGGPFVLLIPFAFCPGLIVQIRMLLEPAASTGRPAAGRAGPAQVMRVRPETTAAVVRVLLSLIVMAGTVVAFILFKINTAGGRWFTLVLAIVVLSPATGAWWLRDAVGPGAVIRQAMI